MLWSSLFWKMTCIGVARTEEILKNTDLSVFWCCLGFVGGCVHACRGGSNRGGGGLFHHIGRHLFYGNIPGKYRKIRSTGVTGSLRDVFWFLVSKSTLDHKGEKILRCESSVNPSVRGAGAAAEVNRSAVRISLLVSPRVACIYISHCTRTARVKLPKLSFPQ